MGGRDAQSEGGLTVDGERRAKFWARAREPLAVAAAVGWLLAFRWGLDGPALEAAGAAAAYLFYLSGE